MLKTKTALLLVMIPLLTSSAMAAPPADKDACNKLSFEMAEKAASKKLSESAATKVDELLAKLEEQCAAGNLTEADSTVKAVEEALAK